MAPLIHLYALLALATTVLASPHISRSVYNHAHRAVAIPSIDLPSRASLPLPQRKRSLNKRCVPRPTTNSTSAVPTTVPTSTAPINVAPIPSLVTSSAPPPPPPSSAADTTSSTPSPTTEAPSTSTPPPPTTSSAPPAQTSSSSSASGIPSYLQGNQNGSGTWYSVGLGACGATSVDSQNIVAVSHSLFDSFPGYDGVNPNTNPVCGKQITATYQGKSVTVTVQDRCTGCNELDLDFSPNAFDTLAAASVGRITMNWSFV